MRFIIIRKPKAKKNNEKNIGDEENKLRLHSFFSKTFVINWSILFDKTFDRVLQNSADSNFSNPSSDLSLDEEKEALRREKERQAVAQLEKSRVSINFYIFFGTGL